MAGNRWSSSELDVRSEERLKARNLKIADLRERSGLSMDELAKLMGFKGQSGIQRYLSPDYDKGFRPELAARFKAALVGRGDPPISVRDLDVFDSWAETGDGLTIDKRKLLDEHVEAGKSTAEYRRALEEMGLPERNSNIASILSRLRKMKSLEPYEGAMVVGLPLLEGHVTLMMPEHLSVESAQTLRDWFDHLTMLATKGELKK